MTVEKKMTQVIFFFKITTKLIKVKENKRASE